MLRKKLNLLFLAFAMLQSCGIFAGKEGKEEKEPEELIKLWLDIAAKNPKKEAHYATHYIYNDFMSGNYSENFSTNMNEVLWKLQLQQSCDTEIFIEKRQKFLDVQTMQKLLYLKLVITNPKYTGETTIHNIKLISNYDSLREYDVIYTTENKKQLKRLQSFIKIDNKWLNLGKPSYKFADEDFKYLTNLNTKELPVEFTNKIVLYVQDHYRIYFLEDKASKIFPIHSKELADILKKALVPEDATIIITASSEIPFTTLVYIFDLLRGHGYYDFKLAENDTLNFFQDSLHKYNMALKARLERDVNIDIASSNRKDVCAVQPVAFAIDSLDKVYILPKFVDVEPVDYEFIKHYLMQSIKANYDSLQLRKNWAYCLDLIICPAGAENSIREQRGQND